MSREIIRLPTQVYNTQQMMVHKAMQDSQLSCQQMMQAMDHAIAFHDANILSQPEIASAIKRGRHVTVRSEYIFEAET